MESKNPKPHNDRPKLLEVVRQRIRLRHLSYTTEKSYLGWIHRFVRFHGKRYPKELGEEEIVSFLSHLAIERNCSPATQNQALNALVFLFRHVLGRDVGTFKDVDFGQRIIVIRDAKGDKDRIVPLPKKLVTRLKEQLEHARQIHNLDIAAGFGRVSLPYALARKYPHADTELIWQYIFPSTKRSVDPRSGSVKRHHLFVASVSSHSGLPSDNASRCCPCLLS